MQLQVCVQRSLLMKRAQWHTKLDCMALLFLVRGPRGGDFGGSGPLREPQARFQYESPRYRFNCN
jgi:hypothetical protein